MTHLTRDELKRWWETGAAGDRARIVEHLALCDECGALYGEIMDAREVEPGLPAQTPAAPLAARASRLVHATEPWWTARRGLLVATAAAAVLVIVAVPVLWRAPDLPTLDEAGVRSATLQPIAPAGATPEPIEFRWASPVAAPRYRVEILDPGGSVMASAVVEAERARLDDLTAERLTPGVEYRWRVTALDEAGRPILTSPDRPFVSTGSR